jgi:hypothetical protein
MIPPEVEVDLAIYPDLGDQGSRETNSAPESAVLQLDGDRDNGDKQVDADRTGRNPDKTDVDDQRPRIKPVLERELKGGPDGDTAAPSAFLAISPGREDVLEGFFEADWDDDID